jgi:hypothetical protein
MKKISTLIAIISSISAHSQYIEPTRFQVEANVGYAFTLGLFNDTNDGLVDTAVSNNGFSGVLTEIGAYYRTGFDSKHLIGLNFNYLGGRKVGNSVIIGDNLFFHKYSQSNLLFIGPSYRKELSNSIGTRFGTISISPGLMFLNTDITGSETAKINGIGYGVNLVMSTGYSIYKDLQLTTNLGMDYSYFTELKDNLPLNTELYMGNTKDSHLFRVKFAVGLRYKL